MILCSDKHDEICFEGGNCPLCELRDDMTSTMKELREDIDNLQSQLDALKEQQ